MPREMVLLMEQKKKEGKSVTTIEDTDLNRSVDNYLVQLKKNN
jgi:hypothetical protein